MLGCNCCCLRTKRQTIIWCVIWAWKILLCTTCCAAAERPSDSRRNNSIQFSFLLESETRLPVLNEKNRSTIFGLWSCARSEFPGIRPVGIVPSVHQARKRRRSADQISGDHAALKWTWSVSGVGGGWTIAFEPVSFYRGWLGKQYLSQYVIQSKTTEDKHFSVLMTSVNHGFEEPQWT